MVNTLQLLASVVVCTVVFWGAAISESVSQPLSREKLCGFLSQLQVDLGDKGKCLAESPVAERDVCYTSSNHLAYYALRYACNNYELADAIHRFLQSYPTDFYDYHQILVGKPFTLPFTAVEHVQVDVVNGVRIVHVKRTAIELTDYYRYANLVVYKALHHLLHSERSECVAELTKLERLWDGKGFADAYYQQNKRYETYKVALALYAYRALQSHQKEIDKYTSKLISINPFTTLYTDNTGEGDLNLETVTITLLALYSTLPTDVYTPRATATEKTQPTPPPIATPTAIAVAVVMIAVIALSLRARHRQRQEQAYYRKNQLHREYQQG